MTDEMVLPFQPVPIFDIPGYGDLVAFTVVDQLKIQSQNEKEKLAKEMVYLKGFYEGVMVVGDNKGKSVQDAKPLIREEVMSAGLAVLYKEPEKLAMSRSGEDRSVTTRLESNLVSLPICTQQAVDQLNTFNDEVKMNFISTLDWLKEHACSRTLAGDRSCLGMSLG